MIEPEPTTSDAMPKSSAELVVIAALTTVFLRHLPRRRRMKFLRDVTEELVRQEQFAEVLRIRPKSEDAAMSTARREAMGWWRRLLGFWVSSMR